MQHSAKASRKVELSSYSDFRQQREKKMTWAIDRLNALCAGAEPPPVVQTLGLGTLDAWGDGWARKHWLPKPELLNVDGSLFGGYLAALADQALAFAAMTVLPADCMFRTVNLHVHFLRVGLAERLLIESRAIAQSRQMISCHVDIRSEDGVLIAEASAQQFVMAVTREGDV
jgi:uncharacterized protein (TIGR00369 family)